MKDYHNLYVQIWHEGTGPYRGAFLVFEGPAPAPPERVLLRRKLDAEHSTPNAAQDEAWEEAKRARDDLSRRG